MKTLVKVGNEILKAYQDANLAYRYGNL